MSVLESSITIYDEHDNIHKISDLVTELKKQPERILVDDEFGISFDISDLDYYVHSFNLESKKLEKTKIKTLHRRKEKNHMFRLNLGDDIAVDVTKDTLFHIENENGQIEYVRADKLKKGMKIMYDKKYGAIIY